MSLVAKLEAIDDDEAQAIALIREWDLHTDTANRHAALGVCVLLEEWQAERTGDSLPDARETLHKCMSSVRDVSGRLDPEWGTVQRHGRDNRTWPAAGGPDTLRAMYAEQLDDEDDFMTVVAGDGLYYLIEWTAEGEQIIRGTHQYGSQMTDPLVTPLSGPSRGVCGRNHECHRAFTSKIAANALGFTKSPTAK